MLQRMTAVLCSLVLLTGVATAAYTEGRRAGALEPMPANLVSGADANVVGELIRRLDEGAVKAPDSAKLVEGAVDGLLQALGDPYAEYYDAEEYAEFNEMLDGEFSGVGMVLEEKPNGLEVVSVLEGTPADRAGVEVGERIVSVDGEDVRDKPIGVVVDLVKGEAGTDVTLGLRGGSAGPRKITMTRERIEVPNLEARRLDDGSGYVKLLQFSTDSGDLVRKAVDRLVDGGAPGIVLDLRNNPGGLLPEAINVASIFVEDGPIVSVKEREGERRMYRARGDALEAIPLVVLVNKGSASASEIVAGAIQDAGRGDIVGETTFGKGTVQTIQRLDAGGGVKFTTAEYFTPSGDSIEDVGVKPDRKVSGADRQLQAAQEALQSMLTRAGTG